MCFHHAQKHHTGTPTQTMIRLPIILLIATIACSVLFSGKNTCAADHSTYCSGMYYCLQETVEGCSAEDYTSDDIPKTDAYCSIFKDLQTRGLRSTTSQGRQIYKKVSGKHRVEYTQEGTLPMPVEVMTYLMNNLPFSAQLINAYQDTNFQAAYLDKAKKRFSGSGESLSGIFTTVLQDEGQTRSLYHGFGTAEVLVWRLSGTALVMFDFEEVGPQEITYRLRCMVFPHGVFVKSILNFFLFRNAIVDVLDETFGDIQNSAMAFHRGERAPIENYPAFATPEGRQQIEEFQLLLQRTMGGTAQAPHLPTAAQEPDDALQ
jgi:hypothetical protein